jgi:hypothetical protein
MRRPLTILVLLCLVLVATVSAAAAPTTNQIEECTWGASSMVVEEVNGQLEQSEPAITGCVP